MARRFDVAAYRERTGQTQHELADDLGVTPRSIRRWELEGIEPSPMALKLLNDHKTKFESSDTPTNDDTPDTTAAPPGPRRRAAILPSLS